MLRRRCLTCDAVLAENGNCDFCNPPDLSALRARRRRIRKPEEVIGNCILMVVAMVLVSVVAQAAGGNMFEILTRPFRWALNFEFGGSGRSLDEINAELQNPPPSQ